uniref:Cilia and flagella associated protein 54 n=1 Tax=Amazona collaria TaxID=241587 RepID=A0A8B9FJF6_9PSIT
MKPRNVLGCLLNPVLMITCFEICRGSNRFGRKEFSQLEVFLICLLVKTANTLFNIWIKYKPRLPEWYYNEKLLKVGDSLAQIKFHALQERNVCIYQMVCSSDRNLQNQESLQTCFNVLSSIRFIMQVALPQENLCWLIYNGTVQIYTICRHLMMIGQSAKVLEYLLWASVCMESSIPLLSVHYLTWRTTLYTAVSQCYFDCQDGIHGEIFARRGLIKIDELKQLEVINSSLENSEKTKIFREAAVKMSVMIFKRAVYEPRRKQKTDFRPKLRVTLKETQNLSWPRTTTEQLLTEMFDGVAAQFLAILEALSDNSRGVCHPAPPLPDEIEICEVIAELFFAGLEILSGNGENGVSGDAAVKFVKLALFMYILLSIITLFFSFQNIQPDEEILVGVIMFLWQKCKSGLQQIQMNGNDYLKYIHEYKAYQVFLYYNLFLLI